VVYLVWFAFVSFVLYVAMGMGEPSIAQMFGGRRSTVSAWSATQLLEQILRIFYTGVAALTALLAVFVGAPLVADDLRANAFPLYLVRPLRPLDYVLGKALVFPVLLAVATLLPGLLFYVLAGTWQPPGETWPVLVGNLPVALRVVEHWLLASAVYGGLVLLVSSRTSRRGLAAVLSGGVIFAGIMLGNVGHWVGTGGGAGDVLRIAHLPRTTIAELLRHAPGASERLLRHLPDPGTVRWFALAVLVVGILFAWRRVRSVEVTA
jgi:ABC-type transport system involved in multi-copper enzyme maturation permease subunit